MARIFDPLLWRVFRHVISGAGAFDTEDIDLDLTVRDAIELVAVDFQYEFFPTTAIQDFGTVLIARPDAGNAVTSIIEATEDPDALATMQTSHPAVVTSGFSLGSDPQHNVRIPFPQGLIIARRLTWCIDSSPASTRTVMRLWYRRAELSAPEIVDLVALRR